ncbi:hypothetical protein, partial [Nitrosomonas europaea]|uniref:hypothetical protein n=1 Tax=Nitrosomonas europaea TaxID=915 RepID=UPI002C1B1281
MRFFVAMFLSRHLSTIYIDVADWNTKNYLGKISNEAVEKIELILKSGIAGMGKPEMHPITIGIKCNQKTTKQNRRITLQNQIILCNVGYTVFAIRIHPAEKKPL